VPLPGQRQHGTHRGRSSHRDGHQHHPQPETFRSAQGDDAQSQIFVDTFPLIIHSWCGPCHKNGHVSTLRNCKNCGAGPFSQNY
jgi:hypothetical protein